MDELKMVTATGCALVLMTLITVSCVSVGYVASIGIAEASDVVTTWTHENYATQRTSIEWGARVDIAEIQADATKKTSWAFLSLYVIRFVIWAGVILAVIGAGLGVMGRWRTNC